MGSTNRANDDGDFIKHFVISKSINVTFKKRRKVLSKLEVHFNGQRVTANDVEDAADNLTYVCNFEKEFYMFPGDSATFQVSYSKKRGKLWSPFKPQSSASERFEILYDNILHRCGGQDQAILFPGRSCDLDTKINLGYGENITEALLILDLVPLLPGHVQDVVESSDSFSRFVNAPPLKSILDNISVTEETLLAIERVVDKLGDIHPLAKAILTAISIPYDLMKNEHEFKESVKNLGDAMHSTCKCLLDVRYHIKITSAKDQFVSVMKIIRDASLFVNRYRMKGHVGQFFDAQFPAKLEGFVEDLVAKKNDFQMAMVMQIARDVYEIASMTSDDFLRKRLDPVTGLPLEDSCLKGTRVSILQESREWIENCVSEKNILWIVGAPGAGKSTIATTIAREFAGEAPSCATFFCKRDVTDLRNPRHIWRTLAYGLANQHVGVKAALMRTLDEKKGDPRNDSVMAQFQQLIVGPLEVAQKEVKFRSHKTRFPLIIIDALDECYHSGEDLNDWKSLLDMLGRWTRLSPAFKLIVTSRDLSDIRKTLGEAAQSISLTTGDDVSDESSSDVRKFFATRFAEVRNDFALRPEWPNDTQVGAITSYAAGLFIWADMVIKYVGLRTGGSNPEQRLNTVLSDIKEQWEEQRGKSLGGRGRVDRLYARILFEAFHQSEPHERDKAKRILATVLLVKVPLQKSDLVKFLTTDSFETDDALISIESTFHELNPIIYNFEDNRTLRVCHKTVSDFLLSHDRCTAAVRAVVESWNSDLKRTKCRASVSDLILNCEAENARIARVFLCLISEFLSEDVVSVRKHFKQPSNLFCNAYQYWFNHLENAGTTWTAMSQEFRVLANELEIAFKCLGQYSSRCSLSRDETLVLTKSISDATSFASECIKQGQLSFADPNIPSGALDHPSKGVDEHAFDVSKASNAFLRNWLQPFDQTPLDAECLEGTRRNVLKVARDWVEDSNQQNILWIYGDPGAGKSAIATSLFNEFSKTRLCAKAFAKRDYASRRDPARIWRTLAYNLACLHVGVKGGIMEVLNEGSDGLETPVGDHLQFRDCIVKVLREQPSLSAVFVIDALDECLVENNEQSKALLQTLVDCASLPHTFKLVITSRDIPDIRNALENFSLPISVATGQAVSDEERHDIKSFLRVKLANVSAVLTEDALDELAGYASGSFIWAKMLADLVKKVGSIGLVKDILIGDREHGDIDTLYGRVLLDALGPLEKRRRGVVRSFLATIILAKDPLRKCDLVDLVTADNSAEEEEICQLVDTMLFELSSILSVDDNELLRIPHKSFSDFLLDHDRSQTALKCLMTSDNDLSTYLINIEDDNATIAISCLRLMNNRLQFNPCKIETSHKLNDDIPMLQERINKHIGSALIYACQYWAEHLNNTIRDDECFRDQVVPLLKTFLCRNLLYWLETLSLVKVIPSAITSLEIAAAVLEGLGYGTELGSVAREALLFLKMFEEIITIAAPHIYLSALPFCPSDSHIAEMYGPRCPRVVSIVSGRRMKWDTSATPAYALLGAVRCAVFFPDGRKLVSGSCDENHEIRIWDARTGRAVTSFTGHTSPVEGVAVSPDGSRIASVDDNGALRIWDSGTGDCPLGSIEALGGDVKSILFSPDSTRINIVTGSRNEDLRVWSVVSGDRCFEKSTRLSGKVDDGLSVAAFSPDGTLVASGSGNGITCIRDAYTGEHYREALNVYPEIVLCIAFSPDGGYLASGSSDEAIHLLDANRGFKELSVGVARSWVYSVCFSPDSNLMVTGSEDGALYFWDIRSGNCEQIGTPIYGHTSIVWSVTFAPDGMSVASGSGEGSIKVWMVPTTSVQLSGATMEKQLNSAILAPESLDARERPVLSDESYIDENGWMRTSRQEGADILFWVPSENRGGVWWPRNTAVIDKNVTKFDFRKFVHGENWAECHVLE